jgi:dihydrofolate reductase
MGRKTWDSIPPKFRPLKGRLNMVISRSFTTPPSPSWPETPDKEPVQAGSLEQAVAYAGNQQQRGKVFVIGGAQIYGAAVRLAEAQPTLAVVKRILLTRVMSDFECDAFFDLKLSEGEEESAKQWRRCAKQELDDWVGEDVPEGLQEENGTSYEFQMWERVD